jgi:hypothetical protein
MNSFRRGLSCATAIFAVFALQACETIKVVSDHDPSFSFAGYDRFAWMSEHPMMSAGPGTNPLLEGRIMAAITDAMRTKGVSLVPDAAQADFVVSFSVGARDRVSVTSTPYPVAYRGAWRWGGAYYHDVDVRQYTEGRLAIDVFDAKEKRPVWHGYATANVSSVTDRVERQALLREAVVKILDGFPPKAD